MKQIMVILSILTVGCCPLKMSSNSKINPFTQDITLDQSTDLRIFFEEALFITTTVEYENNKKFIVIKSVSEEEVSK